MNCLIESPTMTLSKQLERIVWQCALDAKLTLKTNAVVQISSKETFITIQLSVEEAMRDSPSWCLACRLACFCPYSRVSIIISASEYLQGYTKEQFIEPQAV